jgi:hypothetical protein
MEKEAVARTSTQANKEFISDPGRKLSLIISRKRLTIVTSDAEPTNQCGRPDQLDQERPQKTFFSGPDLTDEER